MKNSWDEELLPIGTRIQAVEGTDLAKRYGNRVFKIVGYDTSVYKDFADAYVVSSLGTKLYLYCKHVEEVPTKPKKVDTYYTVSLGVGTNWYLLSGATTTNQEDTYIPTEIVNSNGNLADVVDLLKYTNDWYINKEDNVAFKVTHIESI